MFSKVLDILYSCFGSIISTIDSMVLFSLGDREITLWHLMLGFFICSIIFGFFLVPRGGSVLQTVSNKNSNDNAASARAARAANDKARNEYYQEKTNFYRNRGN